MSSTRAGGPRPRSGLVGRKVAHAAVGTLLVVDGDPVGDDDAGLGERVELLAVEALVPEAGVKGLDVAVLPGRARVDVEGADAAVGQAVADGAGDKLGAVVGADVLGGAVVLNGLGEHDHDVIGADATGDVVGDALLRMLVDEHESAEAAPSRRDVRHEVPRPDMAGVGRLRRDASGGVAAAGPPRLLLRDAEAQQAPQPADLPQADGRQPLGRQEPVDQDLGLAVPQARLAVEDLQQGGLDLRHHPAGLGAVARGVAVQPEDPAGAPLRARRPREDGRQ